VHLQHLLVPLLDECNHKCFPYVAINYQLVLIVLEVPLLLLVVFRVVLEPVELELPVVLIREGNLGRVVCADI
jgi:hypothetical protein